MLILALIIVHLLTEVVNTTQVENKCSLPLKRLFDLGRCLFLVLWCKVRARKRRSGSGMPKAGCNRGWEKGWVSEKRNNMMQANRNLGPLLCVMTNSSAWWANSEAKARRDGINLSDQLTISAIYGVPMLRQLSFQGRQSVSGRGVLTNEYLFMTTGSLQGRKTTMWLCLKERENTLEDRLPIKAWNIFLL